MSETKPTILFMGTPDFALASLETLWKAGYPILAVYSQPDKPAGRGQKLQSPPCALFAKEKGIPLYQPVSIKDEGAIQPARDLKPDFIVVAAYGMFLPQALLECARIDAINVHASLLPRYRGAAPIQWALMNGDTTTGITIIRIIKKMDAGAIYSKREMAIDPNDTSESLFPKLARLGGELLVDTIPLIHSGKLKPEEQDESQVVFSPLIKKEDGRVDWSMPASQIHNRVRAFNPWPTAHTSIDNKLLKIYGSRVLAEQNNQPPGTVTWLNDQGLQVACGEGSLCLTGVQLEGKKRMPAKEFLRGFPVAVGTKLG